MNKSHIFKHAGPGSNFVRLEDDSSRFCVVLLLFFPVPFVIFHCVEKQVRGLGGLTAKVLVSVTQPRRSCYFLFFLRFFSSKSRRTCRITSRLLLMMRRGFLMVEFCCFSLSIQNVFFACFSQYIIWTTSIVMLLTPNLLVAATVEQSKTPKNNDTNIFIWFWSLKFFRLLESSSSLSFIKDLKLFSLYHSRMQNDKTFALVLLIEWQVLFWPWIGLLIQYRYVNCLRTNVVSRLQFFFLVLSVQARGFCKCSHGNISFMKVYTWWWAQYWLHRKKHTYTPLVESLKNLRRFIIDCCAGRVPQSSL